MKDLRMYILVNENIKINKGKLAGQVGHAVASYMYKNHNPYEGFLIPIDDWMKEQKKIILFCDQYRLECLESLGYLSIRDLGYTDLEPNTLTCVNVGIWEKNEYPAELEFINDLKLVR